MEITIKPEEIKELSLEGGKLLMKGNAESQLLKLLKLKDMVEEAIEQAKAGIVENGRKLSPDFKGFYGVEVKGYIKNVGLKYDAINEEYQKVTERIFPDTEKIETYKKQHGTLPEGVTENKRKETLVLAVNKGRALP
jgi:hypothetical protein